MKSPFQDNFGNRGGFSRLGLETSRWPRHPPKTLPDAMTAACSFSGACLEAKAVLPACRPVLCQV